MLTDVQILAGDIRRLKPEAQLALANLVRRSTEYKSKSAAYGDVRAKVKEVCDAAYVAVVIAANPADVPAADAAAITAGATPEDLALAKSLGAICARLSGLPDILVESEGSDKNRRFFSAGQNWEELAGDVLFALYSESMPMAQLFGVVTRKMCHEYSWTEYDELCLTVGRRRIRYPVGSSC